MRRGNFLLMFWFAADRAVLLRRDLVDQPVEPQAPRAPGHDLLALESGRGNVVAGVALVGAPDEEHFLAEPGAVEDAAGDEVETPYELVVELARSLTPDHGDLAGLPGRVVRFAIGPQEILVVDDFVVVPLAVPHDAGPVVLVVVGEGDVERLASAHGVAENLPVGLAADELVLHAASHGEPGCDPETVSALAGKEVLAVVVDEVLGADEFVPDDFHRVGRPPLGRSDDMKFLGGSVSHRSLLPVRRRSIFLARSLSGQVFYLGKTEENVKSALYLPLNLCYDNLINFSFLRRGRIRLRRRFTYYLCCHSNKNISANLP